MTLKTTLVYSTMTSSLPACAGPVSLHFSRAIRMARRESRDGKFVNELSLPIRDQMKVYPLKGGEQLLIHYPWMNFMEEDRRFMTFDQHLFAGMDESAFVTGITPSAFDAFRTGGEGAFFDVLTPPSVRKLSQIFPGTPIGRQGDIWTIKVPMTWLDFADNHAGNNRHRKMARFLGAYYTGTRTNPVLGTNHVLEGKYIDGITMILPGVSLPGLGVGEGVLTATDHTPRILDDSLYVFARTPNILPVSEPQRVAGWE